MTKDTDLLDGNVCIVAGGGRGIGRKTAITLGEYGATVVVNDLGADVHGDGTSEVPAEETAALVEDAGGTALTHFGDITSLEYADSLVEETVAEFGRLDGVVNFAGILRDAISYRMTADEWNDVVRVHLRGHFALLRAAGSHWQGTEFDTQRSFVCTSSRSALGNVGQLNYSSAKAGVLGMTRTASIELERHGVRVNALMPTAYTRMIEDIPKEKRPFTREEMPPERVGEMVAYLMSDAATDVTGCTIRVAGDEVGVVSNPEITRLGVKDDGWSATDLADRFETDVADGLNLDRSGSTF